MNYKPIMVPVTTRVIAVRVNQRRVHGYIIGSLSDNHTVTDESWKCVPHGTWHSDNKWTTAAYDDTSVSL
jgi:hypothetical protein